MSCSLRSGLSSLRGGCGLVKVTSSQEFKDPGPYSSPSSSAWFGPRLAAGQDTKLLNSSEADVTAGALTRGTLPQINPSGSDHNQKHAYSSGWGRNRFKGGSHLFNIYTPYSIMSYILNIYIYIIYMYIFYFNMYILYFILLSILVYFVVLFYCKMPFMLM